MFVILQTLMIVGRQVRKQGERSFARSIQPVAKTAHKA